MNTSNLSVSNVANGVVMANDREMVQELRDNIEQIEGKTAILDHQVLKIRTQIEEDVQTLRDESGQEIGDLR